MRSGASEPSNRAGNSPLAWVGVAVIAAGAALAALVEALLVPLYAGTVIVPVAAVLALAGNLAFPRLARALVPTTFASVIPLLAWLAVMFVLMSSRPEGDVVFPGKPGAVVAVFYATVFGGVLAGIVGVMTAMPPPTQRSVPSAAVSRRQVRR